jgi:hypothetical protein
MKKKKHSRKRNKKKKKRLLSRIEKDKKRENYVKRNYHRMLINVRLKNLVNVMLLLRTKHGYVTKNLIRKNMLKIQLKNIIKRL